MNKKSQRGEYVGKDWKGRRIFMADTTQIERSRANVDKLLVLIGEYKGWGGDISHVFVSDESSIGDFGLEPGEIRQLSRKLRFTVKPADEIHEVAARMGKPH